MQCLSRMFEFRYCFKLTWIGVRIILHRYKYIFDLLMKNFISLCNNLKKLKQYKCKIIEQQQKFKKMLNNFK